MINPIYTGSTITRVKAEFDAEVTAKGQVYLLMPKDRYRIHRDNVDRIMMQDLQSDTKQK